MFLNECVDTVDGPHLFYHAFDLPLLAEDHVVQVLYSLLEL